MTHRYSPECEGCRAQDRRSAATDFVGMVFVLAGMLGFLVFLLSR